MNWYVIKRQESINAQLSQCRKCHKGLPLRSVLELVLSNVFMNVLERKTKTKSETLAEE